MGLVPGRSKYNLKTSIAGMGNNPSEPLPGVVCPVFLYYVADEPRVRMFAPETSLARISDGAQPVACVRRRRRFNSGDGNPAK